MATLTQCLTATLLHKHPKGAGAPQGHDAGPVLARAVLSVLAGAVPERGVAPTRWKGGHGGRGAVAALVAAMLPARQARMGRGGGVVPLARPRGQGGRQVRMVAGHGPALPHPASPPEGAGHAAPVRAGFVPERILGSTRPAGQGQTYPAARTAYAGEQPAPHMQAPQERAGVQPARSTTPPQSTGAGQNAGTSRVATHKSAAARPPLPTGQHVLARGERAGAVQGHKGGGHWVLRQARGPHGATRPVWEHAGLMARVLRHWAVGGSVGGDVRRGAGQGGLQGAGPHVALAPPSTPDYLHATSRAVKVASTAAPLRAAAAPTVQAQITVNATNATAQAIGDELEQRMDTLRMQARQANMGQF